MQIATMRGLMFLPLALIAWTAPLLRSAEAQAPATTTPQGAGNFKVFTARGGPQWRGADGRVTPLARDGVLTGTGELICGAQDKAFVVFSNGYMLLLETESSLAVTRFDQAPIGETRGYLSLAQNPSRCELALELRRGTMTLSVLKDSAQAAGSTFSVTTPAGALTTPAGSLRATVAPGAANGESQVRLVCIKGTLMFSPVLPLGVPPAVGPQPVPLEPGGGVEARVRRDARGRVVALNLLGLAVTRGELQQHIYQFSVALSQALNPAAPAGPYQQPWAPVPVAPRDLPLAPPSGPDDYHTAGRVLAE